MKKKKLVGQIAFRFDSVSLKKMGKSLLLAMTGGAVLAGLDYVGSLEISDPLLAQLVVVLVPFGINAIREFVKGN